MSLETSVSNVLNSLKATSTYYRGLVNDMVESSSDGLNDLDSPDSHRLKFKVVRKAAQYARLPKPPTKENLKDLELPDDPQAQKLTSVNDAFRERAPTVNLVAVNGNFPGSAPDFGISAPVLQNRKVKPVAPTLTDPGQVALTAPLRIAAGPFSGTDVMIPGFSAPDFNPDFHSYYLEGLNLVDGPMSELTIWVNKFLGEKFNPVWTEFDARIKGILGGTEPAVSDAWESNKYDIARHEIAETKRDALDRLDSASSSASGAFLGASEYARMGAEFAAMRESFDAASKAGMDREELETKHLIWAMKLVENLASVAIKMKAEESAWKMEGYRIALVGAQAALDVAKKLLDFKAKQIEIIIKHNDLKTRKIKYLLTIEQSKLSSIKVTLASNENVAKYNDNNRALYEALAGWIAVKIDLFGGQLDYLVTDVEWRKLDLRALESEIDAYEAYVAGRRADFRAMTARVRGDVDAAKAELAKIEVYEAQVLGFQANVKADRARVRSQIAENDNRLAVYLAKTGAQIEWLQSLREDARATLTSIEAGFEAEVSEQELAMASQSLADAEAINRAIYDMELDRTELFAAMADYEVDLAAEKQRASVLQNGGKTFEAISSTAYSGLSAIGLNTVRTEL